MTIEDTPEAEQESSSGRGIIGKGMALIVLAAAGLIGWMAFQTVSDSDGGPSPEEQREFSDQVIALGNAQEESLAIQSWARDFCGSVNEDTVQGKALYEAEGFDIQGSGSVYVGTRFANMGRVLVLAVETYCPEYRDAVINAVG
jgi:hypothetical protein